MIGGNEVESKQIEILRPVDWGKEVITGVTLRNQELVPPHGLSLSKDKVLTDDESKYHRFLLAERIGLKAQSFQFQSQVHGSIVKRVFSQGEESESDGMITNVPGIVLCTLLADCCGILLYDERNKAIGAIHSGWRGTHLEISIKAIDLMKQEFGTRPDEVRVYLSPCASGEKYEVQSDVARLFETGITQKDETHFLFDNRECINNQLIKQAGLLPGNITISKECSISDNRFHSFRRDSANSGRMSAFICMKN